jgi:hypothetical protein
LTENGITRRFVKDIVVAKAIANNGEFKLTIKQRSSANAIKIILTDKQGVIYEFKSVSTAAEVLKINKKAIFQSIRYTGRDVGGFKVEKK